MFGVSLSLAPTPFLDYLLTFWFLGLFFFSFLLFTWGLLVLWALTDQYLLFGAAAGANQSFDMYVHVRTRYCIAGIGTEL